MQGILQTAAYSSACDIHASSKLILQKQSAPFDWYGGIAIDKLGQR